MWSPTKHQVFLDYQVCLLSNIQLGLLVGGFSIFSVYIPRFTPLGLSRVTMLSCAPESLVENPSPQTLTESRIVWYKFPPKRTLETPSRDQEESFPIRVFPMIQCIESNPSTTHSHYTLTDEPTIQNFWVDWISQIITFKYKGTTVDSYPHLANHRKDGSETFSQRMG